MKYNSASQNMHGNERISYSPKCAIVMNRIYAMMTLHSAAQRSRPVDNLHNFYFDFQPTNSNQQLTYACSHA